MDLTGLALRATAARPHVLLVALPGGTAARLEAERLTRLRDWPCVATPAQADLLLVAGPDSPRLRRAVDRLWHDTPAPRALVRAPGADDVPAALEAGRSLLGSAARQREQAAVAADAGRRSEAGGPRGRHGRAHGGGNAAGAGGEDSGGHEGHGGHGGEKDEDRDPGEEHGGQDGQERHAGPGGHRGHGGRHGHTDGQHGGHGGGSTEMPGGLPMAERGEDRDGLVLDRLHVPLGPLLADWPAGLTVRLTLQGDVVQEAVVEEAVAEETDPADGGPGEPFWARPWLRAAAGEPVGAGEAARRRAAAHLDSLARLLSVAGWPAEALVSRRLRDDLLGGAPAAALTPRLDRFVRRVGRSRTLARLTRGIGGVSAREARRAGVSGPAAPGGDVTDRYRRWLAGVRRDVGRLENPAPLRPAAEDSPRGHWRDGRPPSAALVALLPGLLTGAELAAARLIVASLDPDPDELSAVREGAAGHG